MASSTANCSSVCGPVLDWSELPEPELVIDAATTNRIGGHPGLAQFVFATLRADRRTTVASRDPSKISYLYNPAALDEESMLLKASPYSFCAHNHTAVCSSTHQRQLSLRSYAQPWRTLIWLQSPRSHAVPQNADSPVLFDRDHALVRAVIPHAEDARPFRVGGRLHVVFTRRMSSGSGKQVWLAALEPTVRQVPLNYSAARGDEGNWVPLAADEHSEMPSMASPTFLLSYRLCPHVVLRCWALNGVCKEAYRSELPGCKRYLRGGSPLIRSGHGEHLIGVAHAKFSDSRAPGGGGYRHYFVTAQATPPYALEGVSLPFSFPPFFNSTRSGVHPSSNLDRVQFCAGLRRHGDDQLVATYGVGDCVGLMARVPVELAMRAATQREACARCKGAAI